MVSTGGRDEPKGSRSQSLILASLHFSCTDTHEHDLRLPYGWGILVRYIFCSLGGQMEHQERMPVQEAKGLLSPECLQGGCSHRKALAQEDKQWASKALLKLPGRQNGFLVSVPPFPVKGCGSSRTVSPLHPSSCLVDLNAHPQGSAACASAQPSCGAAV